MITGGEWVGELPGSEASGGPRVRERVMAVVVLAFGLLAVVAAVRSQSAGYAVVGVLWLACAVVLWRLTGRWLLLGLALFAGGFATLPLVS